MYWAVNSSSRWRSVPSSISGIIGVRSPDHRVGVLDELGDVQHATSRGQDPAHRAIQQSTDLQVHGVLRFDRCDPVECFDLLPEPSRSKTCRAAK